MIKNLSVCVDFEYRAVPLFLQTKKLIDENILGEESFGTFYTGAGFKALNTIVMSESHLVETVKIKDEKNQIYSIEEFVKLISKWKIRS